MPASDLIPRLKQYLLVCCLLLASPAVLAVERPYAPDNIPGIVVVNAEEVVELILTRSNLLIIDSRKRTEYAKGHIEGAVNLLNTDMQPEDLGMLDPEKNRTMIFYCNGERCLRSSDAIKKAMSWGYKNIFWFRGGWKEWSGKRLPVVTE